MRKLSLILAALVAGSTLAVTPVVNRGTALRVYSNAAFNSHVKWTANYNDVVNLKTNLRSWYKISNGEWIKNGTANAVYFSNVVVVSYTTNNTATKFTNRTRYTNTSRFTNKTRYTNLTTRTYTNSYTNGVLSNSRAVTNIAITSNVVLRTNIALRTNITLRTAYVISYVTNRVASTTNVFLRYPADSRSAPKVAAALVRHYTNNITFISRTNQIYTAAPRLTLTGRPLTASTNMPNWYRVTNTKINKAGYVYILFDNP